MRFKVDENLPPEAARLLREAGHEADSVIDERLQGASDAKLAANCRSERRTFLTLDSDFADIRTYPPASFSGLIVLRLHRTDKEQVLTVLKRLLTALRAEEVVGKLWVVQEHAARIHE